MYETIDEDYSGFDLAFFQRWRDSEHGNVNSIPGFTDSNQYTLDYMTILQSFLSKNNLLIECFNIGKSNQLGSIHDYNWEDLQVLNNRRLKSLQYSHLPALTSDVVRNTQYNIKGGLVFKFTINDMCLCIDKNYIITNLQRYIRAKIKRRKSSAKIIEKYWLKYSWNPHLPFGYKMVLKRAAISL